MSPQTDPGPLEQLRSATRSPLALAVGALLGGFVPVASYVAVHLGGLLVVRGGTATVSTWTSPLWPLVAGALLFSSKSVYAWTVAAFGDRGKAAGFVVLVEGAMLLAPHPWLGYAALAYVTVINAAAAGSRLALRDRADRECAAAPAPVPAHVPTCDPVEPAPVPTLPAAVPAPVEVDTGLYTRAVEVARRADALSAKTLRQHLGVRHATASALVEQLTAAGVLAATTNAKGQRLVLSA